MSELKTSFVKGVIWSLLERVGALAITFTVTIILSRILGPKEYGLVGLLSIFTVLGTVFIDSGFGHALVRKENASKQDYSTIFYLNILIGVVIYGCLYLLSPFISKFYNEPSLTAIARTVFLLIPINSLAIVQNAVLLRNLDFKKISIISVISSIISGIVGITLAVSNFGVWAIIFQTLSFNIAKVIQLWFFSKWRPLFIFKFTVIKELWSYSINLLGVHTLAAVFQNIYTALIGKYFLINDVGYYNQAQKLESIPSGTLSSVIQQVSFPALSKLQNDDVALRSAYKRIIKLTMYINLPLMLGLIVPAENIISIVLSDKWVPSTIYLQLLCIASSIYPMHMVNVIILKAKGLSRKYFYLELFKRSTMIFFILLTINKSIVLLLAGSILATIISVFVNMFYCGRVINYSLKKQILDLLPIFAFTLLMVSSMYAISLIELNKWLELPLQLIVGLMVYWSLSYIFRNDTYSEIVQIARNIIKR